MHEVTSITPTYFFYHNREISRSFDRLDYHLSSISKQEGISVKKIVADQSREIPIITSLKKICDRNNAEYYNIRTDLVFNKALLVNYGLHLTKTDYTAILDLDIVFQKDVFKNSYDMVYNQKAYCNTSVVYLDNIEDYPKIDLMGPPKNTVSFTGYHRHPSEIYKGIQGGIQIASTKLLRDELLGINTKLNLLGGYDNDISRRAHLKGYEIKNVDKENYVCFHLPHKKYQNLHGLLDLKSMYIVKYMNAHIAYHKIPTKFIYKEEEVFGLRVINGDLFWGNNELMFDLKDKNSFTEIIKHLD